MVKYFSKNLTQTQKIAKSLAKKIIKKKNQKTALILTLKGELGAGKTVFLQGFAKAIGIKEKILSPTFIIIRKLKIKNPKLKIKNFYHIDCYRIKKAKEILDLGFEEIIKNPENLVAIEWPEKIQKILAKIKNKVKIKIDFSQNKNKREITICF